VPLALWGEAQKQTDHGRREQHNESRGNSESKEAVDHLVAALEAGQSEVLTQYLAAMAKFHEYSFLCVQ
jgi:hypothetical protein